MDTRYQEQIDELARHQRRSDYRMAIELVAGWIMRGRPGVRLVNSEN